ncbi:MAG: class I SAM-dependent methyltransferase [Halorientalis sp.]
MTLTNRWNRLRYRLYAPVYDVLARPLERGRRRAIERLDPDPDDRVLIVGCGTGVDLASLPADATTVAVDLTPTMVRRTRDRARGLDRDVAVGIADAHALPFDDDAFDAVLLHLVLSVVPDPGAVVEETARVLRPEGRVSLFDKFSPAEGDPALVRRLANPVARLLFADLNRPLEPMLAGTSLAAGEREPFLGGLYTVTVASRDHG